MHFKCFYLFFCVTGGYIVQQARVVQRLDSAIQWINHSAADKYWGYQYCTIQWIKIYQWIALSTV